MDLKNLRKELSKHLIEKNYKLHDVVLEDIDSMTFLSVLIEDLDLKEIVNLNTGINEIVDEIFDPYYKEPYFLEISSAGINRELRTIDHELDAIDNKYEVIVSTKNSKQSIGIIVESENDFIVISTENEDIQISRNKIVKININK